MVRITYVYTDTIFAFYGFIDFFFFTNPFLLLAWLSTIASARFGCLICMCFIFLYLYLFSTTELVSHGKAL